MTGHDLVMKILLSAGLSLALGLIFVPLVIVCARKIGFVAKPRADRWHSRPTALMGGIGIFAASVGAATIAVPDISGLTGVGVAAFLIFGVGLADDVLHLRPQYKLLAQIIAGCVILASNIHFGFSGSPYITLPLTLLFIVGITNAMNLLDNMDGLAAGISLVSALVLCAAAFLIGNPVAAICAGSIAGASLAFLVFNFHPAKVFMGDCGSMYLGLILSVLAVHTSKSATTGLAAAVLFPSIALAIPIFDTVFVSVMRKLNGRAISQGGCDHTSHRLVKLGLTEPQAVILLYGASLIVGACGIAAMRFHTPYLYIAGSLAAALLLVFGRFLAQVEVYPISQAAQAHTSGPGVILAAQRLYKRHTATALMDVLLAFAAYVLATSIGSVEQTGPRLIVGVPWAVIGAATGLGVAGVYRGVWHYLQAEDIARFVGGVAVAGLIAFVGLTLLSFETLSAVRIAILYSAVLLAFLIAARGCYKLLTMALSARKQPLLVGERWLVVARAQSCDGLLKRICDRYGSQTRVAGIVTSVAMVDATAQLGGMPLLGSVDGFESVLTQVEPSAVLVTSRDACDNVEETCRRKGVPCIVAVE
ncbi:MAG: MraY family glycosyltransferase [Armatimonadota bacterium]